MHTFGPTNNAPSSLDAAKVLETSIANIGEPNNPEADAACTVSEMRGDIDALEKETPRHRETITATHAEQGRRIVAVREAGQARPEELWNRLEGPYELSVVKSPTLVLPYELMTEIFDWHLLIGGRRTTTLLVCKRWTIVAYSSP